MRRLHLDFEHSGSRLFASFSVGGGRGKIQLEVCI